MWELKDKYKECCHNDDCESFDTCIDCWDEWAERNPPMTNADRIRAMSDEELAEFISACGCPDHSNYCEASCTVCTLKWLKQPVEGE